MKTYEQLTASITELAAAERITKKLLGELSRDLLAYVMHSEDVRPINALLGLGEDGKFILTAMNWRVACMYFHHFLPFTSNYNDVTKKGITEGRRSANSLLVFAKKSKKRMTKCTELIEQWLLDESNNIWLWQADNLTVAKPKDFAGDIQKSIVKALTGDDDNEPLTVAQVLDAVLAVDGIDAPALFELMGQEQE